MLGGCLFTRHLAELWSLERPVALFAPKDYVVPAPRCTTSAILEAKHLRGGRLVESRCAAALWLSESGRGISLRPGHVLQRVMALTANGSALRWIHCN